MIILSPICLPAVPLGVTLKVTLRCPLKNESKMNIWQLRSASSMSLNAGSRYCKEGSRSTKGRWLFFSSLAVVLVIMKRCDVASSISLLYLAVMLLSSQAGYWALARLTLVFGILNLMIITWLNTPIFTLIKLTYNQSNLNLIRLSV